MWWSLGVGDYRICLSASWVRHCSGSWCQLCPNHLDSLVYKLFPMLLGIFLFHFCHHCSIDNVFYKCQSAEWLEGGALDNTCRRLEEHWELN
jgi:hypothetical protein